VTAAMLIDSSKYEGTDVAFTSIADVKQHPDAYTIVDVRSPSEYEEQKAFEHSINVPLSDLMEKAEEVGNGKPIAVHCAGGYRSAIASSIIERATHKKVLDIGDEIKTILD